MKVLASVYNGFLWSMALTVTLFGNQWLEMRVNMGLIFAASWAVLSVAALLACHIKKLRIPIWVTLACTIACTVYTLLLLGSKRFGIVPAAIIREGAGMSRISFGTVNLTMVVALAIILTVLVIGEIYYRWHRENRR